MSRFRTSTALEISQAAYDVVDQRHDDDGTGGLWVIVAVALALRDETEGTEDQP